MLLLTENELLTEDVIETAKKVIKRILNSFVKRVSALVKYLKNSKLLRPIVNKLKSVNNDVANAKTSTDIQNTKEKMNTINEQIKEAEAEVKKIFSDKMDQKKKDVVGSMQARRDEVKKWVDGKDKRDKEHAKAPTENTKDLDNLMDDLSKLT